MNRPSIIKLKILVTFLTGMIVCSASAFAGVYISGQTCVQSGSTQYTYNIGVTTPTTWNNSTHMSWSASGGATFVGTHSGTPWPSATLTFSGSASPVIITLTTDVGTATLSVSVTTALAGGTVTPITQTVDNQIPATISVNNDGGGACTPSYTYQWMSSTDNVNFSNVTSGGTGASLSFTAQPPVTTYYKRKITETNSSSTAYSTVATVTVIPPLNGNSVTPASQDIFSGATPAALGGSPAYGGSCSTFSYQWNKSSDNSTWVQISGATGLGYNPPALTATTYYMRSVTCTSTYNGQVKNANSTSAVVIVHSHLAAGSITTSPITVPYNVAPGTITATASTGGICASYTYTWQQSTDNINWTAAGSSSLSITIGVIASGTYYYRLQTVCGSETAYTSALTVVVLQPLAPGTIAGPTGTILQFNTSPGLLTNSQSASGGNCSNNYVYKWQYSADGTNYIDIWNGNLSTFTPNGLIANLYFRRKVTCGTETQYSNALYFQVNAEIVAGTIFPNQAMISSGTGPGMLTANAAQGGACPSSYNYQWQQSTDNITWTNAGSTTLTFNPGNLSATTYYRLKVSATCNTDVVYSNTCSIFIGTPATAFNNFIRSRVFAKPGITTITAADATTAVTDVMQTTQYFDGLEKPVQTVAMQQTPLQKDLVSVNVYDIEGRELAKYLPYASTTTDGNSKANPLTEQNSFNTAQFSGETYYYAQVQPEASPLGRVQLNMGPGLSWTGGSRGTAMQYLTNTATEGVRIWYIAAAAGSLPTTTTTYGDAQLIKTVVLDEQKNKVIEYKDKEGHVILKKVQLAASPGVDHTGWLCTYYIYDDLGNLRFVLQPRAVELIAGTWTVTQAIADELCFRYEYDARRNMIIKKIPGAGEVWMVYDARDRVVMTQDANLRTGTVKWKVTEYDTENRPWRTGLLTDANTRSYHQNLASGSTSYPNTTSGYEVLTQTYFDDYSWVAGTGTTLTSTIDATNTSNATYFNTTYNTSPVYARQITPSYMTRGLATGTAAKVIGSASQYLYNVSFFDDKGRGIQTQSINYTGGKDIVTTQYDFTGRVLRHLQQHTKSGTNAQTHTVSTKMNYDFAGRLLTVYKNIDNAGTDQLIVTNTYDELGQLNNKAEGNSLENLAYAYNIRGWMTSINKNYLTNTGSNYFAMELGYDKTASAVTSTSYAAALYNGNITGTVWKTKGDGVNRKFDFTYDNVNRITAANFNQNSSGTTWSNSLIDFTVNNLSYDANGNIITMNQKGFKVNGSALIDQLNYTYQTNSNKLAKVDDVMSDPATKLGDFHDGTNSGTDDYSYDGNGNLNLDNNKAISSITYNYLNLPNVITVTGKGTITYTYDANGTKLKKTVQVGLNSTNTLYIGNFVYLRDTLQFISHEEGRSRWAYHKYLNGSSAYSFEYDYFLKDHLGNTRMVLTQQKDTAQYMATMEVAYRTTENQLFYNLQASNYSRAAVTGYPTDNTTTPNDSIMRLNGSGQKLGAAIVLKVMSGDVVDIAVKSFYKSGGTANTPNSSVSDVLASFANGIVNVASGGKGSLTDLNNTTTSPLFSAINSFNTQNITTPAGKPKAYLNWILLDEQLQYVNTYPQSGAVQAGTADVLNTLGYSGIPITKNGYLYIYVTNETPGWDAFFDNLSVQHRSGPILEETHYYPFGLTMAGISSQALKSNYAVNKFKFQKQELQNKEFSDGSGLETYEFKYRMDDPQIGRFWSIDPLADKYLYNSTYAFSENKVTGHIELEGLESISSTGPIMVLNFLQNLFDPAPDKRTPEQKEQDRRALDKAADKMINWIQDPGNQLMLMMGPVEGAMEGGGSGSKGVQSEVESEVKSVVSSEVKSEVKAGVDATMTNAGQAVTTTAETTSPLNRPSFIVDGQGTAFPVPKGASGPTPVASGKGVQFTGGAGGTNGQVTTMRIMDAVPAKGNAPAYPNGYIKYENAQGQGVNPYTGRTGSKAATHFPIEGWGKN